MVLPVTENQEIGRVEQESTDSRGRSRAYQFVGSVGGNRDRFEQEHCQPSALAQ